MFIGENHDNSDNKEGSRINNRLILGKKDKEVIDIYTKDEEFKRFIRRKEFIAPIVKSVVPELFDKDLDSVVEILDTSNIDYSVQGAGVEDTGAFGEAKIYFDSLADISLPDNLGSVFTGLIFDTEMQRKRKYSYIIDIRAQYYAARLISRQVDKVGKDGEGYNKLVPAYSVWIVCNAPKELAGKVKHFTIRDESGREIGIASEGTGCALMHVVMVYLPALNGNYDATESDELVKFLLAVFTNKLHKSNLTSLIRNNKEAIKEVDNMLAIYEGGIEAAREEGREEGREELILTMFGHGLSIEEISQYTGVDIETVMWLVDKDV